MHDIYDKNFYNWQRDGSYQSAKRIVPDLLSRFPAKSVLDVGCGVGTWLRAFIEEGVENAVGLDGPWVQDKEQFVPEGVIRIQELDRPFRLGQRFDWVVCFEVAEHLPEAAAACFVESLVAHGDVIAFSAAIPFQGGNGHINEQWPEYWASLFRTHGYQCFDAFRPTYWPADEVEWWYAQNMFLAIRDGHPFGGQLEPAAAILPLPHPIRYEQLGQRVAALQEFLGLDDWEMLTISPWPVIAVAMKLVAAGHQECVVAGASARGRAAAQVLKKIGIRVIAFSDRSAILQNHSIDDVEVLSLNKALSLRPSAILISSLTGAEAIENEIQQFALSVSQPVPTIFRIP
jgi:SAM-dependent methyltransferase